MLTYNNKTIGTFTLVQQRKDEATPRKYKIQIRQGNCLAVFLNIYKDPNAEDPTKPWVHQLLSFFSDEAHLKNVFKAEKEHVFQKLFWGKLQNIKLNMAYKECSTLLKYFTKDGYVVKCFYKEGKK